MSIDDSTTSTTSDVTTDAPAPKVKPKAKRTSRAVPAYVRQAGKTHNAAELCRAVSRAVGMDISGRDFRNHLRNTEGYVSGKGGRKRLNIDDVKLQRRQIDYWLARKASRAGK